tara:strand:- start:41 stop:733 length:693 start_codon:yes stop_codon:yes gene_type:complete
MSDEEKEPFYYGGKLNQESFVSYMFHLSQKDKVELMNVTQYIVLAIIPLSILVKLMRSYLPQYDDYKGNIEIIVEVLLQLILLFVFFWFIHRLIHYFPTYSGGTYGSINLFHIVVPLMFVLFSLDTSLSQKVNLLLNRFLVYVGLQKEMMTNICDENEEIVTPPSIHLPPPGNMDNPYPQNTKQESNGVNYNQMYEKTTNKMVGASQPPQNVYSDQGPMAANEVLGLSSF